jgi:MerR family redox-sensitive transcriptional activator SoxR
LDGETGVALSPHSHAGGGKEPTQSDEARVMGMMVRNTGLFDGHVGSLTVKPDFKSSGAVSELLTIGEVAQRAHVAPSAIRYYERLGLLSADARRSGQRRYRNETLRRLVFIGMLQDAGLALDDIHGILDAATVAEWKAIARRRLEILDDHIAQLQHAREVLAGALLCRFDHPATDCKIMGAEIDRRLFEGTGGS